MAVINVNLTCDLQKPVKVQYLDGVLFSQDNQANVINVFVYDNGEPGSISGTVTADIVRSDGGTVTATGGTISGNVVSITLPQAAYAIPGLISVCVKVTSSSVITTIAAVVSNVYQSSTDTAIDPGTIIPSVTALVAQIETAVASIPADYSSLWATIAPAFSSSASYTPGQYVTYNGGLYICTTAHTGSWNASHFSAVNVGGELSRVFGAIQANANGIDTFATYGDFAIGGLNTNGTLKPSETTRVSSNNLSKISFDRDVIVSVKSGYVWGYIPFTGLTPGSWNGWFSDDIIIPSGMEFVVQIRKNPEGTATANVNEYVSALTFNTAVNDGIIDANNALVATGATYKPQVTKISNLNVVTNGTAFVSNNSYETFIAKVHANTQCVITVKNTTTSGLRLSFSSNVPANGVSCTFIEEKAFSSNTEINYAPQADGYLNVSLWKSTTEVEVRETFSGEITKITDSINNYNIPVTVKTINANIPTNGTSYTASNSYRTNYIKAEKGSVYVFAISANAGNNYFRFAKSANEPANGVQATFFEEINSQSTTVTYIYNANSDSFFSVSCYYNVIVSVNVVSMGIKQRIERLESNFIECDKAFDGEYINTKKQLYRVKLNPFGPIQPGESFEIPQDIAIYNGALFTAFNGAKLIMIQDMATGAEIGRPQNNAIGHADSIAFSNEFYDPSDDYPLLYVGTLADGNVCVFRITTNSLTLVKTYHFDISEMGYYLDMCIDPVNMLMYTFGYTENSYNTNPNGTNYIIMGCFDLKDTTTDQGGNIIPNMLYKRKLPYIMTMQGSTMFNGKTWHISSDYTLHNTNIYVISTNGTIANIIGDFDSSIKDKECEGIAFYLSGNKYNMMLLTGDNKLHCVEFAD